MHRRDILKAAVPWTAAAAAPAAPARFTKGICSLIFPRAMPLADQFRQARNAGFEAIEISMGEEIHLGSSPEQVRAVGDAARKAGLAIASFWASQPLGANPLNSPEPEKRARGVEAVRKAVEFARMLECGAVLLVPGRLGSGPKFQVGYETTWRRITEEMRKLLPDAARARVVLTPENVWSKFLVSPLEMRAFVDQFRSAWVGAHFDIANVMQFGYPQDWILTLGHRIKGLHVKDYKLSTRAEQGRFVNLFEGDVDWKEVMAALVQVGYRGCLSPEIGHDPDDPEQLRKISRALDRILAMA